MISQRIAHPLKQHLLVPMQPRSLAHSVTHARTISPSTTGHAPGLPDTEDAFRTVRTGEK
jgi:hypothetical protein